MKAPAILRTPENIQDRLYIVLVLVFVSFCIVAAAVQYPPLIAPWEGAVIYPALDPARVPDVSLRIQEGGDTGGYHGASGYGLLFVGRNVADALGYSLATVRSPVMLYGLLSVGLLFVIAYRWFGRWVALFAAAVMATNVTFINYQHSLVPQTLSIMAMLLCIERYQSFTIKQSWFAIVTFALACTLLALNYLVGRFMMVGIVSLFVAGSHFWNKKEQSLKRTLAKHVTHVLAFAVVFFTTLAFMDQDNLGLLFNREFLFSRLGEYSTGPGEALQGALHNAGFFWSFFVVGGPETRYPSDIALTIHYPIESSIVLLLAGIGMVANLHRLLSREFIVAYGLTGLLVLILAMSHVDAGLPYAASSTLSSYRLCFLIPFLAFFAGAGGLYIFEQMRSVRRHFLYLSLIGIGYFGLRMASFGLEVARYSERLASQSFDFAERPVQDGLRAGGWGYEEKRRAEMTQIYFKRLADHILKQMKAEKEASAPAIVYVSERDFVPEYATWGGKVPTISRPEEFRYYFEMFLTLYLNDAGIRVTYPLRVSDISARTDLIAYASDARSGYDGTYILNPMGPRAARFVLITDPEMLSDFLANGYSEAVHMEVAGPHGN